MAKEASEKSEQPSAKKRQESRRKGMASRSSELPQAVSLVVAAIMLPAAFPALIDRLSGVWATAVSPDTITDPTVATTMLSNLLWEAGRVFIPITAAIAASSTIAQLALSGGKPNPWQLKPRWENLNPAKGAKRLVSIQVVWDLGRTTAKLGLLTGLSYGLYQEVVADVLGGDRTLSDSLLGTGSVLRDLIVRAALAAVLVGIADAVFNRRRFLKQLRMTKQEVKQESKEQEVSPQVKGEIRKRQLAMSRSRMMAEVATADVVITNPTHLAIALRYEPDDPAPKVVAKGAGVFAKRIREEALKNGVPIRENKPLARAMYHLVDVDQMVPAEFFAAVAGVLAAVYRAKRSRR